jgi:hypothetical protein
MRFRRDADGRVDALVLIRDDGESIVPRVRRLQVRPTLVLPACHLFLRAKDGRALTRRR